MRFISDEEKIIQELYKFIAYVYSRDDREAGLISFRDSSSFLGREEDYKSQIAQQARMDLDVKLWSEKWIGTGKIADRAKKAMGRAYNLVDSHQQTEFRNRLNPEHKNFKADAERVLFEIYRGKDEKNAFGRGKYRQKSGFPYAGDEQGSKHNTFKGKFTADSRYGYCA